MRYKAFTYWDVENGDCPVDWVYAEEYEILVDMKTLEVVCVITEPEDRTFTRDLRRVVMLLNAMEDRTNDNP